MAGFDFGNIMGMIGSLPQKIEEVKRAAELQRFEGSAGGDMVRAVVTGAQTVESISISDEALEDKELLEDMMRAALNEALRQAKAGLAEALKSATGDLPIPPGLISGL